MLKVINIYPDYTDDKERQLMLEEAYTDIQRMLYNCKKRNKKEKIEHESREYIE